MNKEYHKKWRAKNKESIKRSDRKWYLKNREKAIARAKDKKYPRDKEKTKLRNQKYFKNNKEKFIAKSIARNFEADKQCGICDREPNLEKHHWDYNRPELFSTLCKSCHRIQHIKGAFK